MANRLERFRAYMSALNATDAASAVAKGLYVPTPGTVVADRLAARLQIQPSAALAIVGGIGSGKTTQLLVARDKLEEAAGNHAIYIDVAERSDLSRLGPGVLALVAGLAICAQLRAAGKGRDPDIERAFWGLKQEAEGRWISQDGVDDWDSQSDRFVKLDGLLVPPPQQRSYAVKNVDAHLRVLLAALKETEPGVVVLFDSLDRLSDLQAFSTVVEQDVRALCALGIGVVMAAPLRTLFGTHRVTLDAFDDFYHLPAVDPHNTEGLGFLDRLLRVRDKQGLLSQGAVQRAAAQSGGALRDLIHLARGAGEEAYLHGADTIEPSHIDVAADAFGRKLLLGLRPSEVTLLEDAAWHGTFVPTTDEELALLASGRVLAYGDAPQRFAVHPTLVPLVAQRAA